jgi:hypothetical protein
LVPLTDKKLLRVWLPEHLYKPNPNKFTFAQNDNEKKDMYLQTIHHSLFNISIYFVMSCGAMSRPSCNLCNEMILVDGLAAEWISLTAFFVMNCLGCTYCSQFVNEDIFFECKFSFHHLQPTNWFIDLFFYVWNFGNAINHEFPYQTQPTSLGSKQA